MSKKAAAAEAAKATPADDWDAAPAVTVTPGEDGLVVVKCIVDTRPWTDTKPLDKDEEASVTPEVAKLMIARGQVQAI